MIRLYKSVVFRNRLILHILKGHLNWRCDNNKVPVKRRQAVRVNNWQELCYHQKIQNLCIYLIGYDIQAKWYCLGSRFSLVLLAATLHQDLRLTVDIWRVTHLFSQINIVFADTASTGRQISDDILLESAFSWQLVVSWILIQIKLKAIAMDPIGSSDNGSTRHWPPGSLHTLGAGGHI